MDRVGDRKALILCLAQSAAGIIFGWGASEGSGLFAMRSYQRRFGQCDIEGTCVLSTTRQSVITGLLSAGAAIGAVGSGSLSGRFGLRRSCIFFILIHLIGAALETAATDTYVQIFLARFLIGLGIGATSGLVPVYQAAASPPKHRGLITGSFQLCITLGIWGVSVTNWAMSRYDDWDVSWRVPIGLQMVFSVVLLVGFAVSPESPRFVPKVARQRRNGSSATTEAHGMAELDTEVSLGAGALGDPFSEVQKERSAKYSECFSSKDRIAWRTMIGILVQIGQQVTGIIFFFSYGIQFAQAAGMANTYVFQVILASVNVLASFPGIFLVDRAGRRPVLLYGAAIMLIGQIVVGSVSLAYPDSTMAGNVLITFTCIFVAAFAISWGPVAWVVCGETFPIRLSGLCVTLGTGANWLSNLAIALIAPQIQAKIGTGICFVWAGCLALAFAFAFFCVPETKGMSIEQIDEFYISGTPAWQSPSIAHPRELGSHSTDPPETLYTDVPTIDSDAIVDSAREPCLLEVCDKEHVGDDKRRFVSDVYPG